MHVFTIIRVLRGLEGGAFTIIRVLRGSEGGVFTITRVLRGSEGVASRLYVFDVGWMGVGGRGPPPRRALQLTVLPTRKTRFMQNVWFL